MAEYDWGTAQAILEKHAAGDDARVAAYATGLEGEALSEPASGIARTEPRPPLKGKLPLDQRLTVVYRILEESDSSLSREQVERVWDGVVRERIARYDCGQAKLRLAADVFAALDKRRSE